MEANEYLTLKLLPLAGDEQGEIELAYCGLAAVPSQYLYAARSHLITPGGHCSEPITRHSVHVLERQSVCVGPNRHASEGNLFSGHSLVGESSCTARIDRRCALF